MQSNDKKSFDKELDKLASGYAQLEHDEPPALLDQAIVNSARRAVEKQPHWSQFGWLHGVTTAAVFVLALALILNQREGPSLEETDFMGAPQQGTQGGEASRARLSDKRDSRQSGAPNGQATLAPAEIASEAAPEPEFRELRTAAPGKARQALDEHEPELERSAGEDAPRDAAAQTIPEVTEKAATELPPPATISALNSAAEAVVELDGEHADAVSGEAEERLQEIIRMKNTGDPYWKTELVRFRDDFPDYPVPEELEE